MFRKLLKYDNRKLRHYILPLFGASTAASILMALMIFIMISMVEIPNPTEAQEAIMGFSMLGIMSVIGLAYFVIIAAFAATTVMIGIRYYRNFISDEGYLTFTLPVTAGSLLNSKMLSGLIWQLLSAVVLVINVIIVCLGFMPVVIQLVAEMHAETWEAMFDGIQMVINSMFGVISTVDVIFFIFIGILTLVASNLMSLGVIFLSLTLGGVVAKKHKLLAGIGLYFAINCGVSLVTQIGNAIFTSIIETSMADAGGYGYIPLGAVNISMLVGAVLYAGVAIGCYFINRHLLKNKLNLT